METVRSRYLNLARKNEGPSIILPWHPSPHVSFLKPDDLVIDLNVMPDYGKLSVQRGSQNASSFARMIQGDERERSESYRRNLIDRMVEEQPDIPTEYWHTDDLSGLQSCYRQSWSRKLFPVCNRFHEIRLELPYSPSELEQEYEVSYRGKGWFRFAWSFVRPKLDRMILKNYRFMYSMDPEVFYQTQREAIIMEQLTHSPRIIDIYGLCGMSMLVEDASGGDLAKEIKPTGGYISQRRLDKKFQSNGEVHPMNNISVADKLELAIVMAESVADIHGYQGGTIVHGDLDPNAWLRNSDGQVKLSDFNLGEILDWNPRQGEYCPAKFNNVLSDGYYSLDGGVHEGTDVFVFGFVLYSLLTGLVPYYNDAANDDDELTEAVLSGTKPYVDARYRYRSVIEGGLVKIMEQCLVFDMDKRLSIFDVVRQLYALKIRSE